MSNTEAEKDEMKDESHDLEDSEQEEEDEENENDADYQQEWGLLDHHLVTSFGSKQSLTTY